MLSVQTVIHLVFIEKCRAENGKSLKCANNPALLDAFCAANNPEECFQYVQ